MDHYAYPHVHRKSYTMNGEQRQVKTTAAAAKSRTGHAHDEVVVVATEWGGGDAN